MIIYFLRHASAGDSKKDPKKDELRALDKEGIEQCRIIGVALAAMDVHVDLLISSPLKRATQTASLVGNELGYEGKMVRDAAMRPDASFAQFRDLVQKHNKLEAIMVVGHNPSESEFLSAIISAGGSEQSVELKKGAVAKIETRGNHGATLQWCMTPKMVRAIYDAVAASSRPKTSRK